MAQTTGGGVEGGDRLSTDALMDEVRGRVRRRFSSLADQREFEAVEELISRAQRRSVLLGDLVRDRDDRRLQTFLRFESHRAIGPLVVFVKRRILFPLSYWLFEFCRDNFERQQAVNRELLASVELLAADNAELRRRLAALEDESGADSDG